MQKMKIGVIGCGNISDAYFKAAQTFKMMDYAYCADLSADAAKAKAELYGCQALGVNELLACKEVEAVLNLTTPQAHAAINMQALNAGKHVYLEKPFALNFAEGKQVVECAAKKQLRVGCAPDTFLGGGLQTCRKLLDDGWIGKPLSGTAFMMCPGHESWHPNPAFYYQKGGGPLFDMGPYYLTALVNLLGPVAKVGALGSMGYEQRLCTSEAKNGTLLPVEVNTHIAGVLEFRNGAVISLVMSFDIKKHSCPLLELHGTRGSLAMPDPNCFGGPVKYAKDGKQDWQEVPIPFGYTNNMRSIGLADMVTGIRQNRPHRCNGNLALHVLEIMASLEKSAAEERFIRLETVCERPQPLPLGLAEGQLD